MRPMQRSSWKILTVSAIAIDDVEIARRLQRIYPDGNRDRVDTTCVTVNKRLWRR